MTTLTDDFSALFRAEHRDVRDALLDLIDAFRDRDRDRIETLLGRVATLTGPHFRYEEESLYPSLTGIFEESYVEYLYEAHDGAIARARELVALAGRETLTDDDVAAAVHAIREILPHVSDCDGLSVMVEVLPEASVRNILATRDRTNELGLDLLTWADTARSRPAVPHA
ncbi:MAG: hemerythrin domain-containing protein [Gaiella sp.]|nr:hemerythrin domain-containing protein [Gaiella sp.]